MTRIKLDYVHEYVDRHGKVRRYLRRHGKKTPLPGLPGSAEFMDAYRVALAGLAPRPIGAGRIREGSMNALIMEFYSSARFHALAPITRSTYRNVIEKFRAEHGDKPVTALQRGHVRHMIDKRAATPEAANNHLDMIRMLMRFAVKIGWRSDDPTTGLERVRTGSAGYHSWSEDEIAAFEAHWPVGTKQRLAFDLLLWTGQRRSDVVRMGRQHLIGGNAIRVRQQKTGADLQIPIHPVLAASLAAAPSGHLSFLTTAYGKPFTAAGFGNKFRDWCDAAKLPRECAAHGLRKAAARRLAEAGCTAHEIMAITGHRTLAEAERYTRAADQKRGAVAALRKLSEAGNGGT